MTELMVSLAIFALLLTGSLSVFIMGLKIWHGSSMDIESMNEASMGLEQMLYGSTTNDHGLRQASTNNTLVTTNSAGWSICFCGSNSFGYSASARVITNQSGQVLCTNVSRSSMTVISNNQACVYIQVTQSHGSSIRSNDLTTTIFFRN